MARICPLFSSSSGNSTYISSASTAVLIDAGASCKALLNSMEAVGCNTEKIKAIAITHEHSDHIKGLNVLLKKLKVPLIASSKTLQALEGMNIIPPQTYIIPTDNGPIEIGDLLVDGFSTSHDCEGSSGYSVILKDNRKISVCTDLGIVTSGVREALKGSSAVLFESNHDIRMLKNGPYPPQLKLRILSDSGHLSNGSCANELPDLLKNGTTRFILGHLSRHNNLPMLALSSAKASLSDIGAKDGTDYILTVAAPERNGVTVI